MKLVEGESILTEERALPLYLIMYLLCMPQFTREKGDRPDIISTDVYMYNMDTTCLTV